MDRARFRKLFKTVGPAVLPVIHVRDTAQAVRNVSLAMGEGAQGVFLINHDFPHADLLPIVAQVRQRFPALWLGVNFLGVTGRDAFPVLGELAAKGIEVDAYWADDARIDERGEAQAEADAIAAARDASGWTGLYFGGAAFKKQREVAPEDYARAAGTAARYMDAVTTSGVATGEAADLAKIADFRRGCGEAPLALASGVTPDNVALYGRLVDAVLVATGVNVPGDFYDIDPGRLRRLVSRARRAALPDAPEESRLPDADRHDRWYLRNMAPTKREGIVTWLDPSSAYVNARSFNAVLDDLIEPFDARDVDVVAAPDAMGFVLGAAIAARLGKGFLALRKAGKLPVEVDSASFTNYTGRAQDLEMRTPAFRPGTRVLLVDQWIETGGTMAAAIELVERQGGIVAGIATICIEETHGAGRYRERYPCSTAVVAGTGFQAQCNAKAPDHFPDYRPEQTFPEIGAAR